MGRGKRPPKGGQSMYDYFLRCEVFEGKPWYAAMCLFFRIGVCQVPPSQVDELRAALARFLYVTRTAPRQDMGDIYKEDTGEILVIGNGMLDPDEMDDYIKSLRS